MRAASGARGQQRARQELPRILEASFEVASVKRNIDGGPTTFNPQATGQFTVINFPFATMITAAYQLQPYQLQAAPSWTREERYDINARLDPKIASRLQPDGHPPTWALALRNLLANGRDSPSIARRGRCRSTRS